jgi:hypothetical protein
MTTHDAVAHEPARFSAWLTRMLEHPRLGRRLAVVAMLFAAPSLFIGFHLDDFIGRYLYSDTEGARELLEILSGGYGGADGNPEHAHWQIEHGFAPWWIYPKLLIAMFRPLSLVGHALEFRYLPDSAVLMHAHSLLWFGALVLAATRFYRGALGALVGGLAAFLFAFDHTHGFAVGFITNRYALITVTFGLLALDQHHRARTSGSRSGIALGTLCYAAALLSGELGLATLGYLAAYALFVDRDRPSARLAALSPYLVATVLWRAAYQRLGYGARFCGLYVDPGQEPAHFLRLLFERGPLLLVGELAAPPAETYSLHPELGPALLGFAAAFLVALAVTLWPLLSRNAVARFFAAGMLFSLVPASTTHPSNRLLFYVSVGAMGLLAQLWELYAVVLKDVALRAAEVVSRAFGSLLLFGHLVVSPLVFPLMTCAVALTTPIEAAFADVGPDAGGRDVVFVTAPDYYSIKLMVMERHVRHEPLPSHWRVLSFGPQNVTVKRPDAHTLSVDYEGGLLGTPVFELYRDRRLRMSPGDTVALEGVVVRVTAVTDDGRPRSADFAFDRALDETSFRFYYWVKNHFAPFELPPVGGTATAPAASITLGLK